MATSPTYPLPVLAPVISAAGIWIPAFEDIYQSYVATFQSIYGSDVVVSADAQDGQWLAALAAALNDANNAMVAIYQGFMPAYAQGAMLDSLCKINGIRRQAGTNSTTTCRMVGTVGTVINFGLVRDVDLNVWALPPSVVIPSTGQIDVTITAAQPGNFSLANGTTLNIITPVIGWQSAITVADSVPGSSVETDAELRQRQAASTNRGQTVLENIQAAVAAVSGVERSHVYANDTGTVDANGIPAHSISAVVSGGDAVAVATAIEQTKNPGTGTYGTTQELITDPGGNVIPINFFELDTSTNSIWVTVTRTKLAGYASTTDALIQQSVSDFINSLGLGEDLYLSWLYGPAQLTGTSEGETFNITSLTMGTTSPGTGTATIVVNFNQVASCDPSQVTVTP